MDNKKNILEKMDIISGIQDIFFELAHLYFLKTYNSISEKNLHPGQAKLIHILYNNDGLSQGEIAKKLNNKPPTVAVSIKRLEKNDIVKRVADKKDQRIFRIYLTKKGKELGNLLSDMINKNERELLNDFTDSEVILLKRFLRQMIENTKNSTPQYSKFNSFNDICKDKHNFIMENENANY